MRRYTNVIALAGLTMSVGILTSASGQNPDSRLSTERRVTQLEQTVANLENLLRIRTEVGGGAEDRTNRDFNLDTRLNDIERSVQQLNNDMLNLQRQVADAARIADQAQRDAQMAQQIARDASNRIR